MEKKPSILVVDDEREIADLVADTLVAEGMDVHVCYGASDALDALERFPYDLAVIDVMMPGMDGFELCRRIRQTSEMSLIFLSAKVEEADKVVGLMLGGDDYIEKPFKKRELVARVRVRLRRSQAPSRRPGVLSARGIEVDVDAHLASLHGVALSLTPKEYGVLRLLVERAGRPVSARDIYEEVWREPFASSSSNSVMVHIRHLREKLARVDSSENFIETAWGVGYRIESDAAFRRGGDAHAQA